MNSICTIATSNNKTELNRWLRSLELIGWNLPVYIIGDVALEGQWMSPLKVDFRVGIEPELVGKSRERLLKEGNWLKLMLKKCDAIDWAMEKGGSTLFTDCDLVFLHPFELLGCEDYDVMLSPHEIKQRDEEMFGRYNGGYAWINNESFTTWWRRTAPKHHTFSGDQQCLVSAPFSFKVGELPMQHNFGWWRLLQCDQPEFRKQQFSTNGVVQFQQKPLISVHSHFGNQYRVFDDFIKEQLKKINHPIVQHL